MTLQINKPVNAKENTIDVSVDVYYEPNNYDYRIKVRSNPELPEMIQICYQELQEKDEHYKNLAVISLDKEMWDNIVYAAEVVFDKSI